MKRTTSPLLWVFWQSLKNFHTSCKIISLKYINKPQHLCGKVYEQIQKANLNTVFSILKGRKLRKVGQNRSSELFCPCSKISVKSLARFIRAGVTSQACIHCIQDRQQLEKSAQLLSERNLSCIYLFNHICTECSETKEKLYNPVWPAIREFKDKQHFSA